MVNVNELVKAFEAIDLATEIKEVEKNGQKTTGIIVGDGNVRPTIYPELIDGDVNDIAREIKENYMNTNIDINSFSNWDYIKENVFPALYPKRDLGDNAGMDFLDLTLMFRVKVDISTKNFGSYVVTKTMLNYIDKTEDDLLVACKENNVMPYEIMPLFQKMIGMMGDDLPEEFVEVVGEMDNGIYFVGNKENRYGGGYLINDAIFEEIAHRIGTDTLYVIPSSIHELLVANGNIISEDELTNIIQDVNATQVTPEEVLSNHPYKYVRNKGFVF